MGSENEPAKLLLPYLQRADELQKHELLVAYYCRLYAMERGLRIPQKDRTKTTNSILISLMNQLEKDKKSLKLGPEDNLYVEGFASNVFAKADKQDRAGRADLNTAKTFYAASIFFEILNQFGEIQPDLEQKQKYAVWKAADIRKALKEGRKPVPGPPGGDKDLSPSSSLSTGYDFDSSENVSSSHHGTGGGSEVPSQFHENGSNYQSSTDFSASHQGTGRPELPPSQFHDEDNNYQSEYHEKRNSPPSSYPTNLPPSSPSDYHHPDEFHPLPPQISRQESSSYPHPPYHHQTSPPREFPPPPYSYPNFQSYPSVNDHSFPSAPTHTPYFQDGSDAPYPQQSAPPPASSFQPPNRYSSEPAPTTSSQTFQYDSNYLPPPEKIAEAHKAARFAVGALAFDDVAIAVDFLRKSLELLTNPSASE